MTDNKGLYKLWSFEDDNSFTHELPGGLRIQFYKRHVASDPKSAEYATVGDGMHTIKRFERREGRGTNIVWYDLIEFLNNMARAYVIGYNDRLKAIHSALEIK